MRNNLKKKVCSLLVATLMTTATFANGFTYGGITVSAEESNVTVQNSGNVEISGEKTYSDINDSTGSGVNTRDVETSTVETTTGETVETSTDETTMPETTVEPTTEEPTTEVRKATPGDAWYSSIVGKTDNTPKTLDDIYVVAFWTLLFLGIQVLINLFEFIFNAF